MSETLEKVDDKSTKENPLWSLTPKVLKDEKRLAKIRPYLNSLKRGVETDDIKNIALTGDYGSGKSTILLTFEDQNRQYEYLKISLASFKDEERNLPSQVKGEDKGKTIEANLDTQDRLIELSILQQIIYQAPPKDIPDSRFQRIVGLSNNDLIRFALGSVLWLISFVILFRYGGIEKVNPDNWTFKLNDLNVGVFLSLPVFLGGIGFFMYRLGRVLSNSKISKVNIKGEVELGKDLSKSILNKHLDEILYFFEQTKFNIVLIEDLDRFKTTQIFTKLREINLLLNKSSSIRNQNRKIVFIYAIRDEMFETSERVKFFDYIVPVIPFINPSNAKDQFYNLLKTEKLESELKKEFIDDVVTYIDDIDMRLLTNVFQEFSIYKLQMGSGILYDNLFALILYKNLYPSDFTLLPRRQGKLFNFLNGKNGYVKQLTKDVNEEILKLKLEIQNIESERVDGYEELKNIYISAINKQTEAIEVNIDDEWHRFNYLYEGENLLALIEEEEFTYRKLRRNAQNGLYDYSKINGNSTFSSIENTVNEEFSFLERKQHIENKEEDTLEELKSELLDKELLKSNIKSWNLEEIFQKLNIGEYLSSFKHKDLMGNLLTNGYIDENYNEYITLFHEAKMTLSDKDYIKMVKSGQRCEFKYYLSNPSEIIGDIPIRYFSRKEILNYHILGYLLRWEEGFLDKKKVLINQICEVKSGSKEEHDMFKFINGYIKFYENALREPMPRTTGSVSELVRLLSSRTGLLWNTLLSQQSSAQSPIHKYIKLIVAHADPEELKLNSNSSRFKNYLTINSSIINLFRGHEESQKLVDILNSLGVKFSKLVSREDSNIKIYDFLYENSYYQLSSHNIKEVVSGYNSMNENFNIDLLNTANYTTIQQSDCEYLKEYVEDCINSYIETVFLKTPKNKDESEESVISLLNNSDITEDNKEKIIKKVDARVNDLAMINSLTASIMLFENDKVYISWKNIFNFYQSFGNEISKELIECFDQEKNYKILKEQLIDVDLKEVDKDELKSFCVSLIKCNELSQTSYSDLLKSLPADFKRWKNIDINELDEEKVSFLIGNNNLSLTKANFDSIKNSFEDLLGKFLVHNNVKVLNLLEKSELSLTTEELDMLYDSEKVDDTIKEQLIKEYDRGRIATDDKVSILIGQISGKYNKSDLTYSELKVILSKRRINDREKINMLNNHFDRLNYSEIEALCSSISSRHRNIFDPSKRQKFTRTDSLELFAKRLKRANLIKNYHLEKDDRLIRFYPNT